MNTPDSTVKSILTDKIRHYEQRLKLANQEVLLLEEILKHLYEIGKEP